MKSERKLGRDGLGFGAGRDVALLGEPKAGLTRTGVSGFRSEGWSTGSCKSGGTQQGLEEVKMV